MSFNFIVKQRESADHEKSSKGRVTAVRMDRRSEKSEDGRRMYNAEPSHEIMNVERIIFKY